MGQFPQLVGGISGAYLEAGVTDGISRSWLVAILRGSGKVEHPSLFGRRGRRRGVRAGEGHRDLTSGCSRLTVLPLDKC